MNSPDDLNRRRWLTTASITGGAGLVATSVPFAASMAPSERAKALGAPVAVNVQDLAPGAIRTVEWRGKPVFVFRRTPQMLASLPAHHALLADPMSRRSIQPPDAVNPTRSLRSEIGVIEAVCTHLGCVPTYRPEPGAADLGAGWPGGFFCPCHGSKFDLAGRVFKNVPAPTNLTVPPYVFTSESALLIGADSAA